MPLTSFYNLPASTQVDKMANYLALLDPIIERLNRYIRILERQVESLREEEELMMRRYEVLEEYAADRDRALDYYRTIIACFFDVGDELDRELWRQMMQQVSDNQFNGAFNDDIPAEEDPDNWEVRENVRRRLFD